MVSPQLIAQEFADTYYPLLQTNPSALSAIYRDNSSLVWQGQTFTGKQNIINRLTSLNISNVTTQTIVGEERNTGRVNVSVLGSLVINDEKNARQFQHVLLLDRHYENYFIRDQFFAFVV